KPSCLAVEVLLEEKIEDVVNFLGSSEGSRSQLYDDILALVERCLIRIALKRTNNVKTSAAAFLGINRNTLHKKMDQLNIPYRD
ncbi:MAG TPA: helix-turn-helix domain-containing protein, partial [Syntrophales bacterium]|nr:helix-turn-helix domain-containing protein [Syntrophales bacterium]